MDKRVEAAVDAYEQAFNASPIWTREQRCVAMIAAISAADAVSAAGVVPDGWYLVPAVSTEEMNVAGCKADDPLGGLVDWRGNETTTREAVDTVYRAMLSAAPPAPLRTEEEIRKDERERCAKIAETPDEDDDAIDRQVRRNVAAAIRQEET